MQELKEKLCKIDEETDWLKIMKEAGHPEVQIQIRAEIVRAIKRIDKALKQEIRNENHKTIG